MFEVEVFEHELHVEEAMYPVKERIFDDVEEEELRQELGEGRQSRARGCEAGACEKRKSDRAHGQHDEQMTQQTAAEHAPHARLIGGDGLEDLVRRHEVKLLDDEVGQVAQEPNHFVSQKHASYEDHRWTKPLLHY